MRARQDRGRQHQERAERPVRLADNLCCVYWCRDPGVIEVELEGKAYPCCRKHAPFMKAGRLDWFDR